MKKHLIDFLEFIKNPKDEKHNQIDSTYKWKVFFSLFIAELIFITIYLPVLFWVNEALNLNDSFDLDLGIIAQFFIFVLSIPLIEEFFLDTI